MPKEAVPGTTARMAGAACIIAIMAINIWRAFGGPATLSTALIAAALVLIAVEYRNIPFNLRVTAFSLFGAGMLVLPFARSPFAAVQRGIFVGGLLLALMASVMLLARCALRSGRVHLVGKRLRAQQPRRRYGSFTFASQLFSAMLGMAGANIMMVMAAPPAARNKDDKTAAVVAVTRGFSAAGCWSPMFGNMAILLALYPTLAWIEVFPVGVALAQLIVIVGVVMNRFSRHNTVIRERDGASAGLAAAVPLLVAMLAFLVLVLGASRLLTISTTAAVVLLGPAGAALLNIATAHRGKRVAEGMRRMRNDVMHFRGLASEAILFLAAGCAGSIMGDAFPAAWAMEIGSMLDGLPLLGIAFLMTGIMSTSLLGIHPVLSAVFLASTITPQILGLPPVVHIAALLTGWGLSASVTPFSVLTLTASRYSGNTLFQISVGKNWAFALINALLACALLTAVAYFMSL